MHFTLVCLWRRRTHAARRDNHVTTKLFQQVRSLLTIFLIEINGFVGDNLHQKACYSKSFASWYVGARLIKSLGTGLYLSPGGDFGGITWFLGEQKWGSVITENPKGEITENFGRIQSGSHSNFLRKWRRGGGESRKSSNGIRGITSVQ